MPDDRDPGSPREERCPDERRVVQVDEVELLAAEQTCERPRGGGNLCQLAGEEEPAQAVVVARPDVGERGHRPDDDLGAAATEELGGRPVRAVHGCVKALAVEGCDEVAEADRRTPELRPMVHVEDALRWSQECLSRWTKLSSCSMPRRPRLLILNQYYWPGREAT